jgi:small basic protein
MVVEAKIMKRWEFDSVNQASSLISSWFSGNYSECQILQDYLNSISPKGKSLNDMSSEFLYSCLQVQSIYMLAVAGDVFYDALNEILTPDWDSESAHSDGDQSGDVQCVRVSSSFTSSSYTPPPCSGPYKRRKIIRSDSGSNMSEEPYSEFVTSPRYASSSCCSDNDFSKPLVEPSTYKDVLILFRFSDGDLPFRLKEVILSDVRLLTLLEYGLPSWVIFLQSYPVFCKIYRPWMCPLARALYVLISLITVLIGFYDLYKNVPMLKATASRLFGPLFDWIETWEMISRLKYLGTMLFLHHFEQAFTWSLKIVRATKSVLSVLTKPVMGPLLEVLEFTLPLWNLCAETVEYLSSAIMIVMETSCSAVISAVQTIMWPFWFIFSTMFNIGMVAITSETSVSFFRCVCVLMPYHYFCLTAANSIIYPVIWFFGEILAAPFRLVAALASFVADFFDDIVDILRQTWSTLSSLYQVGSASRASGVTSETTIWGSLWKDLLYQVT